MRDPERPWRELAAAGQLAVLLIRHGQTRLNAEKRFCGGRSDPPLNEVGQAQARALGERLRGELDAVYSSTQRRAIETACSLGWAEDALPTFADLRELDQGALEGQSFSGALAEHPEFFAAWRRDPATVRVPGGESMSEVGERAHARLCAIAKGARGARGEKTTGGAGKVIAVVAHQMTQATAICRALDQPLDRWAEYELSNAQANLLSWDRGRWTLHARKV